MRLLYNQLCGCVIELFVKPLWFRFSRLRQLSHFRHEINIYIFFWVTILEQILRKESWKKKAQSPNRASPLRTLKPRKIPPIWEKLVFIRFLIFVYLLDPNLSNLVFDSALSHVPQSPLHRLCFNSIPTDWYPRVSIWAQLLCVNQFKGLVRLFEFFRVF